MTRKDDFRAVVSVEGVERTHGPYSSYDQAGKMAMSWARRRQREDGASAESVTYRVQTARWDDPEQRWLDVGPTLAGDRQWVPDLESRPRRVCRYCELPLVDVAGIWVTIDAGPQNGSTTCQAAASHSPHRKGTSA